MSLGVWLEKWNFFAPENVALVNGDTGERWTYQEFYRRSMHHAQWLVSLGVKAGDRVAWTEKNRPEFFSIFFACARLGAILVPVNWRLAKPEVDWILDNCKATVVCDEKTLSEIPAFDVNAEIPTIPAADVDEKTVVMILYTSGTTGRPKGALLTHGSITANSVNTTVACDLRSTDSTITYTPLFHTGAVNVLSVPLFHRGGKVVLTEKFDAAQVLSLTASENVTILFGVPTTFEMLRDHADFATTDMSSVRFSLCGGAPCPIGLIHDYSAKNVTFRQGYGLTEVGPNCFSLPPVDAVRKAGTVGRPVMHCDARIVDADGNDVPQGTVGELWLRGPHVCAGYWQNQEATDKALKNGWWATGDLFEIDEDGYYKVVGRKKEMFISGGENVYPAEVEQAIMTFEGVKECCVVGVPDEKWGEVGCGYIAPATVSGEELKKYLLTQIAKYKIPKHWVIVEALPHTASGKVDRRGLKELGEPGKAGAGSSATKLASLLLFLLLSLFSNSAMAAGEVGSPRVLTADQTKQAIFGLAIYDTKLVSADRTGKAVLWDLVSKSVSGDFPAEKCAFLAAAVYKNTAALALQNGQVKIYALDKTVKVEKKDDLVFKTVHTIQPPKRGSGQQELWNRPQATAVAFNEDGTELAIGYSNGDMKVITVVDGSEKKEHRRVHSRRIVQIAAVPKSVSQLGNWVTASWDGTIRIVKGRPKKVIKVCKPELSGICYLARTKHFVVASHVGDLYFFDAEAGLKLAKKAQNPEGWIAFPSANKYFIAAASPNDNSLAFFKPSGELVSREKIATIDVKEKRVLTISVANDKFVVTGNTDGTLTLFTITSSE